MLKSFSHFIWNQGTNFFLFLFMLAGVVGCEQVTSDFRFQDATQDLLPEAADSVKKTLSDTFGTPARPTAPHYFPVERGGEKFVVDQFDPQQPSQISLETSEKSIALNLPVEFLFDPEDAFDLLMDATEAEEENPFLKLAGLTSSSYDSEQGLLKFNSDLPNIELIEPGLEVVIDPNHKLRQASLLYAQHCLHCHGVTGDGKGPTAPFMEPKPRDYRQGIFKFTSTGPQDKISTADLKAVLYEGIPGTYMPSFNMLPDDQLDLIVSYVKFLAMRGEAEKNLVIEVGVDFSQEVLADELEGVDDEAERKKILADFDEELQEFLEYDYPEIELGVLLDLADEWAAADDPDAILLPSIPRPDANSPSLANPEVTSLENGRLLYLGKDAQCASCHGDQGLGNGYQTFQFQKKQDGSLYETVGLHDTWGNPLPPRNLITGVYRGGRRPIDVFRRIYAGIKGTPMPVFGGKGLSDEQIWDIVNYVLSMSAEIPGGPVGAAQNSSSSSTSKNLTKSQVVIQAAR